MKKQANKSKYNEKRKKGEEGIKGKIGLLGYCAGFCPTCLLRSSLFIFSYRSYSVYPSVFDGAVYSR